MKLSIITINLNNSDGLFKTVNSVINQSCKEFEYIIIDGGSVDSSRQIIEKYLPSIHYWSSEPDDGIYPAMNKGIIKSAGEYCLFLNSGDYFVDRNVVSDFYGKQFHADIIAGTVNYVNGPPTRKYIQPNPEDLTYDFFVKDSLMHQATFIKRALFERFGLYKPEYRIVSDWEFFFRVLLIHNCTYEVFNRAISNIDMQGISWQSEWKKTQEKEREQVFKNLLPRLIPMQKELEMLRESNQEYQNLKEGLFGCIIHFFLWIKALKKKYAAK